MADSFLNSQKSAYIGKIKLDQSNQLETSIALEAKRFDLDSFHGNGNGLIFESNSGPSC